MAEFKLKVEYEVSGNMRIGGYDSDPTYGSDIEPYRETKYIEPDKSFVEAYCNEQGIVVNSDGEPAQEGSGYLRKLSLGYSMYTSGNKLSKQAISAKLVKLDNIKAQFLSQFEDDEEITPPPPPPKVNRITNARKTNPFGDKCKSIPCKFGKDCDYNDTLNRTCYYKH
jgi:hypothetical protein